MDSAFETFLAEAFELLEGMESALLRISEGDQDPETLNELFRGAHTIKGSAGLFGLDAIVSFTHDVENVIDRVRDGEIVFDKPLIDVLFSCRDHILTLVNDTSSDEKDETLLSQGNALLKSLQPWKASSSLGAVEKAIEDEATENGIWHISFRLGADVLKNGMDPIAIFRFLGTMGTLKYIGVVDEFLPTENFDPEELYLGFEIGLETNESRSSIEDAFMFVRDDAQLKMLPPNSAIESYIDLILTSPNENKLLGEILVDCGAITQTELDSALSTQAKTSVRTKPRPIGEVLSDEAFVDPKVIDAALISQRKKSSDNGKQRFIRVDSQRLDTLINLIGEMVITRQRIDTLASEVRNSALDEAVTTMGGLTEQVQDAALNLRMVPIADTLQRFKRVVRDSSSDLGKNIQLQLVGEETELDRSMVEKITDPLTHIVRNAIDHGIETPQERKAAHKPEMGTLKIMAFHDAGNIVIEITDDGRGLNSEKIRAKAISKGLISSTQEVSEADLHQMIFHPGFSTAEAVTNLSGRGVGMDVVRRNIEDLQGGIDIESTVGKGTKFKIRLPLTLAIIDGFHVSASGTDFILPQAAVIECLDYHDTKHVAGGNKIDLRGDLVPFVEIQKLMGLPNVPHERKEIVIVQFGNDRAGIVVDDLHGELKTVVKPLSPIFSSLMGVGGSTLLGNGAIAFILDVPQLINFAVARESNINLLTQGASHE